MERARPGSPRPVRYGVGGCPPLSRRLGRTYHHAPRKMRRGVSSPTPPPNVGMLTSATTARHRATDASALFYPAPGTSSGRTARDRELTDGSPARSSPRSPSPGATSTCRWSLADCSRLPSRAAGGRSRGASRGHLGVICGAGSVSGRSAGQPERVAGLTPDARCRHRYRCRVAASEASGAARGSSPFRWCPDLADLCHGG